MTAEQEGAAAASGVLEFIESLKHATDEETRAAAHAASKTWSSGTPQAAPPPEALAQLLAGYAQLGGNPQAVLAQHQAFQQARVPPHPLVRAITGALAAAFLCVFAWGMHAIVAIRTDFDAYLATDTFSVQVTRVQRLRGPLNALVPPSYDAATLAALPAPTEHQQWWALMSESSAHSDDTQDVEHARDIVLWLVAVQVFLLLLKLAYAVLRNKPDQVKSLSTGLDLMIGMAILGALFPMHWNAEHGIVMIMYVPGWAILWSLLWMVSTSAACLTFAYQAMRPHNRAQHLNRETLFLGCVATGSCCYWMWCLYFPLLYYALNFAQDYAEAVTAQALDEDLVAALPFAGASAAALYLPIRIASRLGMGAWVASVFLLPQLNARLMLRQDGGGDGDDDDDGGAAAAGGRGGGAAALV